MSIVNEILKERRQFIEGMEFALRLCRNQAEDCRLTGRLSLSHGAENCCGVIRLAQVQVGAGRMALPEFTAAERAEIERIA